MKDKYEERDRLERMIISALLTDYDRFVDYIDIPYTEFGKQNWQILKLILEQKTWDATILSNNSKDVSFEEILDVASELIICGDKEFIGYVETLKELIERDKLIRNLNTVVANIKDWADLWKIYTELNNIKIEWNKEEDMKDVLQRVYRQSLWLEKVKIIPTWYSDLDKLVWWYEEWQIVVIWARPWIWKSMFAINLMNNNILAGEKVALFSLEMNWEQVMRRLLAMNSGVWVWKLKEKNDWEAEDRITKWVERLEKQLDNLDIIDNVHTITDVERRIRYLVHKKGTKVFYLDYLQLIKNPSVKNNPVESITDMSQRLKQLALELKITIIELSQLNRDADNSVIQKASQLRGSWSIEQDADMIWILQKDDESSDLLTVWVRKCRDWRIWDVELKQISDVMRIMDKIKPF